MSMDKAIKHGKEYRKAYRGSKAIDITCRNHGTCEACRSNRMHKFAKSTAFLIDMKRYYEMSNI